MHTEQSQRKGYMTKRDSPQAHVEHLVSLILNNTMLMVEKCLFGTFKYEISVKIRKSRLLEEKR